MGFIDYLNKKKELNEDMPKPIAEGINISCDVVITGATVEEKEEMQHTLTKAIFEGFRKAYPDETKSVYRVFYKN